MRSNILSSDDEEERTKAELQADFRTHSELADGWGYLHERKQKDKVKQGAWHHQQKLASKEHGFIKESARHTDSSLVDGYSKGWRYLRDDVTKTIPPTTTDTSPSNCQSWLNLRFKSFCMQVGLRLVAAFLAMIGGCLVLAFFQSDFTALGAGCVAFMVILIQGVQHFRPGG